MYSSAVEYLALFGASFLAATILPFPSEVPLAVVVRNRHEFLIPVLVATAGNFLGACTTYLLARGALAAIAQRWDVTQSRALWLWRRYGAPTLLLSWLPAIGDGFVVLAGASGVAFASFSLWTLLGKGARYAVVAWLVGQG
jgi:membrane protein YqaA with SNARE-associated domain